MTGTLRFTRPTVTGGFWMWLLNRHSIALAL
jgi:hypothetical protein